MANVEQTRRWCGDVRAILKIGKGAGVAAELAALPKGGVDHAKLLLRWRAAQAGATARLVALGDQVLALPEVQADPRLAELRRAVAGLPALIPTFGDALADQLDAMANGGPGAGASRAAALATVAAYRQQLRAVPVLTRLAGFASAKLKTDLPIVDELDATLAEMAAALNAAP